VLSTLPQSISLFPYTEPVINPVGDEARNSIIDRLFGCAWVADFAGLCRILPSYLVEVV
jgi:hypothetical protein